MRALGGNVVRDDRVALSDLRRPTGMTNAAVLVQPVTSDEGWNRLLAQLDDYFGFAERPGAGEVFLFSHWPTPDLSAHGWNLAGYPARHVLPAGAVALPPPAELTIERVGGAAELAEWERLVITDFTFNHLDPTVPGSLVDPALLTDQRMRFWLGRVNGEVVAASQLALGHGVREAVVVVTKASALKRGYGAALTWQASLAAPEWPAVLISSDEGRPVYDQMGFPRLTRITLWFRNR